MAGFNITGSIKGAKKFYQQIQSLEVEMKQSQIKAVQDAVFLIHAEAVKSIQDNSSGDLQTRYNPKRSVRVSRPGEPPNTDTGRAAKSIQFDFLKDGLVGRVGTNLKYLRALEFGFRTKYAKVEARPWLSRAVQVVSKDIAKIFKDAFKKSTKKVK